MTISCGNGESLTRDEMTARVKSIEEFVALTYNTDCSRDYVCQPVPVSEARNIIREIRWDGFNVEAVDLLFACMKVGTLVSVGRCDGPLLEFTKPGSWKGGVRGMFKKAIAKVEEEFNLGYTRKLCQQHGYILFWNEEDREDG